MTARAEVARCPACHHAIFDDHPYAWCKECGASLPEEIRAVLPSQQHPTVAPASAGDAIPEDAETVDPGYRSAEAFALARPGYLTLAILCTCVVIALLTLVGDAETTRARQYAWGLQVNDEVAAGEWWRLLAAAFLHGGWSHLLANMYALFVVGSVVERGLGRPRLLAIYVLAALGGGIASFFLVDVPTLGASGAIFGLFGAAIWVSITQGQIPGAPLSKDGLKGLGYWAAYSLFMGFTHPQINNVAHLGGLATGAAVAAVLPFGRVAVGLATLCGMMLLLTGARMGLSAREAPRIAAFSRAIAAAQAKQGDVAMAELDRAVPFPKALEMRAALRLDKGDYVGALADADAALATGRRGESRWRAHYFRAHALLKLGRPAQAFSSVQMALETRNPEARALVNELKREILLAVPDSGPHPPAAVHAVLQPDTASNAEPVSPVLHRPTDSLRPAPPDFEPVTVRKCEIDGFHARASITVQLVVGVDGRPEPGTIHAIDATSPAAHLLEREAQIQYARCVYTPARRRGLPIRHRITFKLTVPGE